MSISFVLYGLANFVYIALRAFQQKNNAHDKYLWMVPTSYGMGYCEVFLIASIAVSTNPFLMAFALGTGGWMGSMAATFLHNHWRNHE